MYKEEKMLPHVKAILNFQEEISKKTGREVSLSEAIANWIAFGYAEQYRRSYFHLKH